MEIARAYRTKLDPTAEEKRFFARCAGVARYVYNWALNDRKTAWEERQEHVNHYEQKRRFNALKATLCPFVSEVPYSVTEQVFQNIDRAFQNFFRRVREGREAPGFPRFKNRDSRQSFTLRGSVRAESKRVKLPVIGWVRLAEADFLPTGGVKILSAAISRQADNWYISLQVMEEVAEPEPPSGDVLGVDMGYGVLAVTSDGTIYPNPEILARYEKKLARLQRELSRRKKGSANRQKTKAKIAKLHAKIANVRLHHLHNTSRWIVDKQARTIAVEGFRVDKLMQDDSFASKKARRAKRLADAAIGELRRELSYKQEWAGGVYIEADATDPTNRRCHVCGYVQNNVPPSRETWKCSGCGAEHDRRLNTAQNLVQLARPT
jgi:putative transposase